MEVEGLGVCRVVVQRDAADACPSAMPPFCGRHRSNFGINCIFFNNFYSYELVPLPSAESASVARTLQCRHLQ